MFFTIRQAVLTSISVEVSQKIVRKRKRKANGTILSFSWSVLYPNIALGQSVREKSLRSCKICFITALEPGTDYSVVFKSLRCLFQRLLVCSLLKFSNFTYFACSSAIAISFSPTVMSSFRYLLTVPSNLKTF